MRTQNKRKVIIGIVIAVVLIAGFGIGINMLDHGINKDSAEGGGKASTEPVILYFGDDEYEVTHNIETYLLIGTDDSGNPDGQGEEYRGRMADFLLLLVLDRTENTYGFIQINRDTMMDVPYMDTNGNGEGNAFEQICIAHWYGGKPEHGCNNTVYCVKTLLGGLPINGYYSIHMGEVGALNDAVGGVEVTLDEDFSKLDPEMTKGATLTLNDEQAEKFVRGRMEIGDGENLSRMQRQLQYMQGYKAKLHEQMESNPEFITQMYEMLKDSAVTDITENHVSIISNQIYKGEDLGIFQIEGEKKTGDTLHDGIIHAEFYPDTDSIAEDIVTLCGIDEEHIYRYEDTGEEE